MYLFKLKEWEENNKSDSWRSIYYNFIYDRGWKKMFDFFENLKISSTFLELKMHFKAKYFKFIDTVPSSQSEYSILCASSTSL